MMPADLPVRATEAPQLSAPGRQALRLLNEDDLPGALEALAGKAATPVDKALLGTLYLELGRPADALAVLAPEADAPGADAAVLYNAGRAAQALGQLPAAEQYFERAVQLIPVSPAARELGLLRGGQGDFFEAYRLLRPWLERRPDDEEARLAAAACALQLERPAEAEGLLGGLTSSGPRVTLLRGQLLLQQGDPMAAITAFEPLLEDHPPAMEQDLLSLLADAYTVVGRSAEAVALLAPFAGRDARLDLLLSEARYRVGEVEGAAATLEPWLARDGLDPDLQRRVTLAYGRHMVAASRAEEALPHLQQVTGSDPGSALAWKTLGDALVALGRREEAKEALARFRELTVRDSEAKRRAAAALEDPVMKTLMGARRELAADEPDRALGLLRKEAALSPEDPRPRLFETRILMTRGRLEEAWRAAVTTRERFPDNADAIYHVGALRLARGEIESGIADLRRALELAPEHTELMNDLAVALMQVGETGEARHLLERILVLRPNDERAADNFRRLEAGEDPGS
jgi:Flp pilus assembly protein TadD